VSAEHVGGDTNKLQVQQLVGDLPRTPTRNTNKGEDNENFLNGWVAQ